MSTPRPDSHLHGQPTPDDLAGIPVSKEEAQPAIRVRGTSGVKVRGGGGTVSGTPPQPSEPPTADDLAGIPILSEGDEDLTIRARKPRQQA
jgi:hypothetical protein